MHGGGAWDWHQGNWSHGDGGDCHGNWFGDGGGESGCWAKRGTAPLEGRLKYIIRNLLLVEI